MRLIRTPEGHLLTWERGTTRYTLGYRITRTIKRWYVARWQIAVRPFAAHFIAYPMTEAEKRRRRHAGYGEKLIAALGEAQDAG